MGLYLTNENPVDPPGAPKPPVNKCENCKNCSCKKKPVPNPQQPKEQ
jgi:hypothetical protein